MNSNSKTPKDILVEDGFKFLMNKGSTEIYYRPKDIKRNSDNSVYYSYTVLSKYNSIRYSLNTSYNIMFCKEEKNLLMGIHTVPFIGKVIYKDLTKDGIKATDIKNIQSDIEKRLFKLLCK